MTWTNKPTLLDLYCGAGGAAMGYHRAGFHVVGVDIKPQPRYPFQFFQMDALDFAADYGRWFDVIHASPPCQRFTSLNRITSIKRHTKTYDDLIEPTRQLLQLIGKPYIIENVQGAPLHSSLMLCGSMFAGLKVYRHRFFETNCFMWQPHHAPHCDKTPPSGQGVSPKGFVSITSGGLKNLPDGWSSPAAYKNMAMGIDWMTQKELTESIPPAYTEYLGKQLLKQIS